MLLGKEIKKTVLSIPFFLFLIALLAMPVTQGVLDFSDDVLRAPVPGEDYGMQPKEVPELLMPEAFYSLYAEFTANNYIAYPIGFYKNVRLKDAEREKMAEIISALSGISAADLLDAEKNETQRNREITLSGDISYEEFKAYMKQADALIGGGSKYSEAFLAEFSYVPVTYEDAVESYNLIAEKDKFTGAYARLFCDYVGILLSVLPVFPAVAMCLKDSRAKMGDLIHARKVSSSRLIISRYFAILIAVMLPALLLAYLSNMTVWEQYSGMTLDYFAPLKYSLAWLLPSAMIAAAVGMFFTELTGTPLAIAIQGLWWFVDSNAGVSRQGGIHTLSELTPRHNSLRNTQTWLDAFPVFAANRLLMTGAALLLVAATVIVYEQKRKGVFGSYGKIKERFTNLADRKSKSAA